MGAQPGCAIWLCTIQRLTIHAKISLNYAEKALKITHEGYYILLNKRSGVVASSKEAFLHITWNLAVFSTSWLTFTCCWMAGLYCLANLHIVKSEYWKKTTETASRKCFATCSVKLSKFHRKLPVAESHLNIVAEFQGVTLLRKRPWYRCSPVIAINKFKI